MIAESALPLRSATSPPFSSQALTRVIVKEDVLSMRLI